MNPVWVYTQQIRLSRNFSLGTTLCSMVETNMEDHYPLLSKNLILSYLVKQGRHLGYSNEGLGQDLVFVPFANVMKKTSIKSF